MSKILCFSPSGRPPLILLCSCVSVLTARQRLSSILGSEAFSLSRLCVGFFVVVLFCIFGLIINFEQWSVLLEKVVRLKVVFLLFLLFFLLLLFLLLLLLFLYFGLIINFEQLSVLLEKVVRLKQANNIPVQSSPLLLVCIVLLDRQTDTHFCWYGSY